MGVLTNPIVQALAGFVILQAVHMLQKYVDSKPKLAADERQAAAFIASHKALSDTLGLAVNALAAKNATVTNVLTNPLVKDVEKDVVAAVTAAPIAPDTAPAPQVNTIAPAPAPGAAAVSNDSIAG